MASQLQVTVPFVSLFLIYLVGWAYAAGECGRTPINTAAASLGPCRDAATNVRVKVPPPCCAKVNALLKSSPRCLCAVILSPIAKKSGVKPGIAITIPKRCNIRNRPVGKKCGSYTVP
ncbi:Bifunctional inhibitor/lipid-transfer protein/seed storage 2S albumin superfamily protein [Abeliophyllum distichum]|uniref:Bifunctional inhibitor/lipid-transfer protein/seed storage 2S albumin superfamily protein n=1 Tax=Abeliophyllum distichum TaxID=126358 RepID=A0ABD1VYK5_9LAMI